MVTAADIGKQIEYDGSVNLIGELYLCNVFDSGKVAVKDNAGWVYEVDADKVRLCRPSPPNPARTVRVRIAVCVNAAGDWSAAGDDSWNDKQAIEKASGTYLMSGDRICFIEANVPLPEALTVEGRVLTSGGHPASGES